ncbi:tail fiber protein [Thermus virus IN93]|uniref:Lysozyme n=1 Tax=Thermus virus IN93 TaxID=1714273 RepID=Q859R8_9VIRU|nr:tail fiber protein [Thermus virus IN93]BAC55303.1 lysozyme [Thermus virus IN93]
MSVRITNFGLDAVARVDSGSSSNSSFPYFHKWSRYTAIGTGTTPPNQTDTALASEVARTDSNGGFSHTEQYVRDSTNNKLRAVITEYRVFNFTNSYNLTEYGHFTQSTGANCVFRDLFRQDPNNPNSTPVVISVQSGDQLQIIKTVVIEVPWLETTYSIIITGMAGKDGNGTHDVVGTAFATEDALVLEVMRVLWPGGYTASGHAYFHAITASGQSTARGTSINTSAGYAMTGDAYTNGSYTRTKRYKLTTAQENGTIYGFAVNNSSVSGTSNLGYKMLFQNPSSITKASTHTLEMVFQMTWGRG